MKAITICTLAFAATAMAALTSIAAENRGERAKATPAIFEKFKALNGVWEMQGGHDEHGMPNGSVTYKVTAGGSAVLETVFAGSEHEMVTLYYV
jgi:hypothetical protein